MDLSKHSQQPISKSVSCDDARYGIASNPNYRLTGNGF